MFLWKLEWNSENFCESSRKLCQWFNLIFVSGDTIRRLTRISPPFELEFLYCELFAYSDQAIHRKINEIGAKIVRRERNLIDRKWVWFASLRPFESDESLSASNSYIDNNLLLQLSLTPELLLAEARFVQIWAKNLTTNCCRLPTICGVIAKISLSLDFCFRYLGLLIFQLIAMCRCSTFAGQT